jgi:hypothetical protein
MIHSRRGKCEFHREGGILFVDQCIDPFISMENGFSIVAITVIKRDTAPGVIGFSRRAELMEKS